MALSFLFQDYFRKSGSEKGSLLMSEIVFAFGDVLNYINNRAFEQVGEYVGKEEPVVGTRTRTNYSESSTGFQIDPDIFISAIESVELLLESLAELYCMKFSSNAFKWVVVGIIQTMK